MIKKWPTSQIDSSIKIYNTLGAAWEDFHNIAAHASGLLQQTKAQEIYYRNHGMKSLKGRRSKLEAL